METKHVLHCTKCKTEENLLKYSKKFNKAKTIATQYYYCRDCNRKRASAYYKTPTGQKNIYKANKKQWSSEEGRVKHNARVLLHYYIRKGTIVKPDCCSECGGTQPRIEAHHEDYSKPLEVIWLCSPCHSEADKELAKRLSTQ